MATDQSASRAARRQLAEHLRDNWTWPPTFTPLETDEDPIVKATLTRERYYSSYSSEDEDETPISNPSTAAATVGLEKREHARTMSDPYRFEGPDAVGPELKKETESKRRRRWREEAEEMTWNEGLRCWIERRDYWTGATGVRRRAVGVSTMHGTNGHAIAAQINPALYPEIYTKVVLSSRTPSVPINLADMTRALVQGWKDDGEWPPKPSIPEPVIAGKRGKLARRVVPGMRGEVGEGGQGAVASREKHPHVKRGVESVKRAFRLSGSGSGERSEEKLGD
ncbi:hypothetical protein M501DRAFT_1009059 [Patellaria atrata CBS 101060]|uniref:Gag1-like clamp domain-containing protein n=1 Tax=Patellaria atrata CBS 101060 TaxID=1346257 RepID=A0A9P4S364_9PEZI|nr:hypothetical protein M501DRAFT_1009059 [Patellaria atrata CBS 101060]